MPGLWSIHSHLRCYRSAVDYNCCRLFSFMNSDCILERGKTSSCLGRFLVLPKMQSPTPFCFPFLFPSTLISSLIFCLLAYVKDLFVPEISNTFLAQEWLLSRVPRLMWTWGVSGVPVAHSWGSSVHQTLRPQRGEVSAPLQQKHWRQIGDEDCPFIWKKSQLI